MSNEIIEVPMEVELLETTKEKLEIAGYTPVAISELSTFGIVGNELLQMVEAIKNPGGEGIYRVTFPKGVSGTLTKFKNENAFMGAISNGRGFGAQARLTQIQFNPQNLFMAVALIGINIKLGEILEVQKTMLEFMYAKEESKIHGSYQMLNEAIGNYRYNWDQEKYINQNIGLVRNIKTDMYKTINLYTKKIEDILLTPKRLHFIRDAGKKVRELSRLIRDYHDAHYLLIYATFFETLLMKNFTGANLDNINNTITSHLDTYQKLYQRSYKWAENYIMSSINYKAAPVLYSVDKFYENGLRKISIGADQLYGAESELYRPVDEQLKALKQYKETGTNIFAEEINKINTFHNKELEMYIDDNNVYLIENIEE